MNKQSFYNQVMSTEPLIANDERIFSMAKAKQLIEKLGFSNSFIPTRFPGVDDIVTRHNVRILYDVPYGEHEYPYTDGAETPVTIHMPYPGAFASPEQYASTLLHELAHWAGNTISPRKMEFNILMRVLSDFYETEEIVAETAAFLLETKFGIINPVSLPYLAGYVHGAAEKRFAWYGSPQKGWDWAMTEADKTVAALLGQPKE